jgi:maltose alpha-D-glucosyltransferase/alpha-amylase
LCEANQWPEDVRPYFGDGDEFNIGFHFPIMPRIFMAIKKGRITDVVEILRRTPSIPENCQWCTFLRNHDELTLEMVTPEEREWMWQQYAPEPRMRLNLGIRRRLAPLLDNDQRKIELANSLLFTLPGSPILYYGDEIGMGDDIWLPDRNGVRTPMQWTAGSNAGFSDASSTQLYSPVITGSDYDRAHVNVESQRRDLDSLFHLTRRMISSRKQHQVFGWGDFTWIDTGNEAVASYLRVYGEEGLFVFNNLCDNMQVIRIPEEMAGHYQDVLKNRKVDLRGELTLNPYQYLWLLRNDKNTD